MRSSIRVVLAVAAFAGLQELALRAVFPLPAVLGFDRLHYSPLQLAPDVAAASGLGHASYRWASDPDGFSFVHELNLYGFRDKEWRRRKPAGSTRIAFFGDSFVEGLSAAADETLPAAFADLARAAGTEVDVMNFGIAGASLPAYAGLMRDALPIFAPDAVVLVLYANDILPTPFDSTWLVPEASFEESSTWAPRLLHVARRLRAGQPVARRWTREPFEYLPSVPDPRNPWTDGATAGRLEAFVAADIARAIRKGRFNPALVESLPWYRKHLARPHTIDSHIVALARHVRATGAVFHVVYVPTKNQVSDRYLAAQSRFSPPGSAISMLGESYQTHARLLAETCRRANIRYLDLTPALRAAEASAGPLYWDYDDHMRGAGYGVAASALHSWLGSDDG
jgi:lysophospholipase L1-like esterase